LKTLKVELGKKDYHKIKLKNPSPKEALVKWEISNPANYTIEPILINIPPFSE